MSANQTQPLNIPSIQNQPKLPRPRGFAAMDPQRQREIASLGGKAAHASGHAHQYTSEEARAAGKKRHQQKLQGSSL
jgi:general stress protein YciG